MGCALTSVSVDLFCLSLAVVCERERMARAMSAGVALAGTGFLIGIQTESASPVLNGSYAMPPSALSLSLSYHDVPR